MYKCHFCECHFRTTKDVEPFGKRGLWQCKSLLRCFNRLLAEVDRLKLDNRQLKHRMEAAK